MVVDESTRIKTPRAQRTKRILGLGRHAKYRRILTGTPVTQSPFDIYSQFAFLGYELLGFFSYTSFKHNYGRWEKKFTRKGDKSWEYEELIEYIHLDDLRQRLKPHYYRREKSECLDLPSKVYKVIGIDLSPQQRRLYEQVESEGVLEFDDFRLLTPLQITRLLRCQQITGGFLPTGEQGVARPLKDNPKLDLMLELVEDHPGKTIIWARFRAEIMAIVAKLKETYGYDQVVEYHGGVPSNKRPEMVKRFQEGDARFLVGQQASGVGIDLYAAETVFYFSNDFSYDHRYQSEDRCHRIGLKHPVLYIDLIANDTADERIRWVHERARKSAEAVLGKG
jgi:SNF2 family DNA or RNA helicase